MTPARTTDEAWRALVHVVRSLTARTEGSTVSGTYAIASQDDLDALVACFEASNDTKVAVEEHDEMDTLRLGMTVQLRVTPRFGFGVIASTLADLLQAQGAKAKAKKRFLILEGMIDGANPVEPASPVGRYLLVLKLVETLRDAAALFSSEDETLIFLNDGRFDVPVRYEIADILAINLEEVTKLTEVLSSDTLKKQCTAILATAVVELSRGEKSEDRFRYILGHAADLRLRYDQGYNMFVAGFSYDTLRDTVETARLEYVAKIHKVFSDIQSQLLSVPVATIIVATQMKRADKFDYEFFVNTAVLVGCWVFVVLLDLLLRNQRHTLEVIKAEIDRQKTKLERDHQPIRKSFDGVFEHLRARVKVQARILWTIDAVVAGGLVLSHIVYFNLTPDAWQWVIHRLAM